jgi:hypothetical protein
MLPTGGQLAQLHGQMLKGAGAEDGFPVIAYGLALEYGCAAGCQPGLKAK